MSRLLAAYFGLGLSVRILVGLGLGLLVGLFLGEPAAALQPIADIYVKLMQMTVLPYLVTALIIAFGSLSADEARRLVRYGGLLLLVVWLCTVAAIGLTPLSFPSVENASFFSHALVEPKQTLSLTDIYFTSNPFESLSKAVVPAVVLFSCLVGASLIGLDVRDRLLGPLGVWNAALARLTRALIHLTPLGVFAIAGVAAGTMTPETLVRLEVYFIAFGAVSLLLAFWVLPLLVTAVTPFRYSEVVSVARDALLTAFVTNNAFIVLPLLVERSKDLMSRHGLLNEDADAAAEVFVPVLFNFPNAGKLLTLLFVPFAAWLSGAPLSAGEFTELFASGIPSYFAKAQVALPFLLDLLGLPHDLLQLYIPTTIVTGKLDAMVTAMNLLVFALLGAGAMGGFLNFQRGRVLASVAMIVAGTVGTVFALRLMLPLVVVTDYTKDDVVRHMHRATSDVVSVVHRPSDPPVAPGTATDGGISRLEQIRARGTLRFGYDAQNLPFSFFNADGELVGYDVQVAEKLAATLDLVAEFVPISWTDLPKMLADGRIDLMPGVWYRPNWLGQLRLSAPYLVGTVGFATLDTRRHEFESVDMLRNAKGLRIAIPLDQRQVKAAVDHYFGEAEVELVTVHFWKPFFEGQHPDIDAFMMPAEHASGWSLLHPEYSVVVPLPDPLRVPSAFAAPLRADELIVLVDEWLVYAESSGALQRAYEHWVLGEGAKTPKPRWSIMRDVLGWGDGG
ncbi:MAG: cation:dicarboxylate symporter family transporter [Gammaproteobacteria bacterium]